MLYLSLGTNLGDRYDNIDRAIFLIKQRLENVTMVAPSIETAPVGFESKNNFLNTVVEVETKKSVEEILHITQSIEQEMGRTQKSVDGKYHDRIIDIDILFYDDIEVHTPQLQLPHPHIAQRLFVLEPLAQVNPDLVHPYYGKQSLNSLLNVNVVALMCYLFQRLLLSFVYALTNYLRNSARRHIP